MGTLVEATVCFGPNASGEAAAATQEQLAGALRRLIGEIEQELSRFQDDSDVAQLVRAYGAWTPVGTHTAVVLRRAIALREATDGLFDPAPPGRLIAVRPSPPTSPPGGAHRYEARLDGTDQHDPQYSPTGPPGGAHHYEARLGGTDQHDPRHSPTGPPGGAHRYEARLGGIDRRDSSAWGLAGEAPGAEPPLLDLGAIGKGYAADQALRLCLDLGATSALVAVGVSSIAAAAPRDHRPWRIGIRSPGAARDEALGVLEVHLGGVAASSTDEQPGHVRDPRTLRAPADEVAQATVVAGSALVADAVSTALLVGGTALAARLAHRLPEAQTILVTKDSVLVSPALRASFRPTYR
ncbi:MAG: FAD:protein FMN transferase [Bifidobacteriaceae bacterium]|jgi:thiamine biosynthesis lipoprotein ApbE|nr:FAD:protein FMN transferase [Bifidobacteriaceae bacterium]